MKTVLKHEYKLKKIIADNLENAINNRYIEITDEEYERVNNAIESYNTAVKEMRDHHTRKDVFYLYKAWWNPEPFVHICQKSYTKKEDRVIKCYTNSTEQFSLYVNPTGENDVPVETLTLTNNILEFTATTFSSGDVILVTDGTVEDTFIIDPTE